MAAEPNGATAAVTRQSNRATVALEDAPILDQQEFAGNQHILRVHAPRAAARAAPGTFAHISCDPSVRLRRPLSIMRASSTEGWLEFLYKPRGDGLEKLARRRRGEILSVLAPIGRGFSPLPNRPRWIALGGGVGIPPMIFLAEHARTQPEVAMLVVMGSELPFPFELCPSQLATPGICTDASHAVALLEGWGIPSRLASNAGLPGCHRGFVTDAARDFLRALPAEQLAESQLLGCGPSPMLQALAALARDFDLPCQVALEEFMACGIGGCAGCNVLVQSPEGPAMKRVCVDGPVFDASAVFPA